MEKSPDLDHSTQDLALSAAERILARAAALDSGRAERMPVQHLREAAAEAGISPDAIAAALREHARDATVASDGLTVPAWVRMCTFGVPDRVAALRYYWIFVAGLCASPLLLRLESTPARSRLFALTAAAICFGALWSTSRAVRWLDQHGWQRLP
jgi:hypothetical protein